MVVGKLVVLAVVATVAQCGLIPAGLPIGYPGIIGHGALEPSSPPHYSFSYGISDPHTGDVKEQEETRVGDAVKGHYAVNEPDGTRRVVHYTADDHNGFNAVVEKQGHAAHPATIAKVALAPAPLALAHGPGPLALGHGHALAYGPGPLALGPGPLGPYGHGAYGPYGPGPLALHGHGLAQSSVSTVNIAHAAPIAHLGYGHY